MAKPFPVRALVSGLSGFALLEAVLYIGFSPPQRAKVMLGAAIVFLVMGLAGYGLRRLRPGRR